MNLQTFSISGQEKSSVWWDRGRIYCCFCMRVQLALDHPHGLVHPRGSCILPSGLHQLQLGAVDFLQ